MVGWLGWFAAASAEPAGVTLDEAVTASATVPAVRGLEAGRETAEARLEQARASRLPAVGISGSVSVWNGPQTLVFEIPGLPTDGPEIEVRDQVTASLSAHTALPLTGQLAMGRRVGAAGEGLASAESLLAMSAVDARYQAADAWFVARQADRQLEIAVAQVRSLEGRVAVAEVAYQGGTVTRNEVLKADLALARAQQAVIQTQGMRDAARGRLGLAIGNGGEAVVAAGDADTPPRSAPEVGALVAHALASRADLTALRAQAGAGDKMAEAASLDRIPQLSAVGVYVHTEGQGPFAEPDAAYVGANLEWTLWGWGARGAAVDVARGIAAQVRAQLEGAEAAVRLEVHTRADALAVAAAAYDVAQRSIGQAEENLKIEETLRDAGSGTMTDLLDAEAALVEAKSRSTNALYEAKRAEVALERAVGADPWEGS